MGEGELARSIETNPGVRSARVHLTLGDPSPFEQQQRPATASVSLVTAGNGSITREAARGIAMLVANSVEGLDMKHVVVLDERSEALYDGNEATANGSIASSKLDMEQAVARKEEIRIQSALDGIFGVGTTKVMANCDINMDETHEHKTVQQTKKGAVTQSATEKYGMAGAGPAKGAGMASQNTDNTKAAVTLDGKPNDNYESIVSKTEPTRIETTTDTKPAVGTIKSMTITVTADNKEDKFGDPERLASLTKVVKSQIAGKDPSKFKAEVVAAKFDDSSKTMIVKAQEDSKGAARMQQMLSMLPIAALLIVGVMVVKQLGKLTKSSVGRVVTPDGQILQMPMGGLGQASYAMGRSPDGVEGQDAEAYHRAISKYTDEELAKMGEDGIIYRDNSEILEVEKIREKKSVHLSAIKKMAKDRPEPTAMLIKTWLTEQAPR
ncbi:MAG: flagellar M-ring protein FliF C-terminal domain-containing protein, partial [Armatimonadota bacterium]